MNLFKKNNLLILIYKNMDTSNYSEPIDIILSPQFYTVKIINKSELPIKYSYQAKKIANSIFSGLIDNKISFKYIVFEEKDSWTFIAYNQEEILDFLKSKNLNNFYNVYFSQQLISFLTSPLQIDKNNSLINLNDLAVIVPNTILKNEDSVLLTNIIRPKKSISFSSDNIGSILNKKQSILFSAIFLCFSIMFFIDGKIHSNNISFLKDKLSDIYEDNSALKSSYTRKSILLKYRELNKQEKTKRDTLKLISRIVFKGIDLTNLKLDEKKIAVTFKINKKENFNKFKEITKKNNLKINKKGKSVSIEVKL